MTPEEVFSHPLFLGLFVGVLVVCVILLSWSLGYTAGRARGERDERAKK